jgi:hypothetical protein
MRSIKELLQVMLDNQDLFTSGLCNWAIRLYYKDIISYEESKLLDSYIENNRPSKYSSLKAYKARKTWWYWPHGEIKPRLKWIKKHIKLNS